MSAVGLGQKASLVGLGLGLGLGSVSVGLGLGLALWVRLMGQAYGPAYG
jgi:hypothetical protein